LHFLWQGCAVALVAACAGWILRPASANARYAVNVAALVLMVACLPITYSLVHLVSPDLVVETAEGGRHTTSTMGMPPSLQLAKGGRTSDEDRIAAVEGSPHALASGDRRTLQAEDGTLAGGPSLANLRRAWKTASERLGSLPVRFAPHVTAVYFLGVAAMLFRLARALWGSHRLRRDSAPVDDEGLLSMVRRQAQRMGLQTAPTLAWCRRVSVPLMVGMVKPVILLPTSLATGLNPTQVESLLMHELAHVRRYDPAVNLLQRLIEAALFFHPAVWYVSRRVSIERENACDDSVVSAGWQRLEYADALVRMAELCDARQGAIAAHQVAILSASGGSPSQFRRRVLRLLEVHQRPRVVLTRGGIAVVALLLVLLLTTPWFVRNWAHAADERSPERRNTTVRSVPNNDARHAGQEAATETMEELIRSAGGLLRKDEEDRIVEPPGRPAMDGPASSAILLRRKPDQRDTRLVSQTQGDAATAEKRDGLTATEILQKVIEANRVWLDPRPKQLSYTVTGSDPTKPDRTAMVNRVWMSGDKARWEMDAQVKWATRELPWNYAAVFTPEETICLRAPNKVKATGMKRVRDTRCLRQGMIWHTAIHAVAQDGIPANCRIVEETKTGDHPVVVIEMNLDGPVADVGLGHYGLTLGQFGWQLNRVRLHIRLPEYVPIREEYVDRTTHALKGNIVVSYGPKFITVDGCSAPTRFHVAHVEKDGGPNALGIREWIMEGHFREAQGVWLLDKALNIHDGKVARQLRVSNVSTAVIAPKVFAIPEHTDEDPATTGRVSDDANLDALWKKVLEVNSVWLDPQPPRLSYTLTASSRDPEIRAKYVNRVWIDGKRSRWEMDDMRPDDSEDDDPKLDYTLVCDAEQERYLRAPHDSMLNKPQPSRNIRNLRQGITWSTAIHAAYWNGLPPDSRIAETRAAGDGEIVVIEMDLQRYRSSAGLGLYHCFLGRSSWRTGRVRLHIKTPEHVPVLEEFLNEGLEGSRIEYDPGYFALGKQLAPKIIRHVSEGEAPNMKRWVLEAHFQATGGMWLLEKALNIQDGKIVTDIVLSDMSTAAIDPDRFATREKTPAADP